MKYRVIFLLLITAANLSTPSSALSAGVFLTNGYTQVAPVALKAAIIFDGTTETIFESITFNLNPLTVWSFIYLIPVPAEPKVELVNDGFFTKIDSLIQSKFKKETLWEKMLYFDIDEDKHIPPDVYTRDIDLLRVEVFSPEKKFSEIEATISDMGYHVPKAAKTTIEKYQNMGWYLVAAEVNALHIQMNATDSLSVNGATTYPIKVSFQTDKPIYPLAFTAIVPDVDSTHIPLSFDYGSTSEKLLGETIEKVDDLLGKQSQNQYPFLPLDYSNIKIDLFVFSDRKATVDGFRTVYADRFDLSTTIVDAKGVSYLNVPKFTPFLTKLSTYRPILQLEDVAIKPATSNKRVNPTISTGEKLARITFGVICMSFISYLILRRVKHTRQS